MFRNSQILYNGERANVLNVFEAQGFSCPDNYNPADYLIDVISAKDFDSTPFVENVHGQVAEELANKKTSAYPVGFPKRTRKKLTISN